MDVVCISTSENSLQNQFYIIYFIVGRRHTTSIQLPTEQSIYIARAHTHAHTHTHTHTHTRVTYTKVHVLSAFNLDYIHRNPMSSSKRVEADIKSSNEIPAMFSSTSSSTSTSSMMSSKKSIACSSSSLPVCRFSTCSVLSEVVVVDVVNSNISSASLSRKTKSQFAQTHQPEK